MTRLLSLLTAFAVICVQPAYSALVTIVTDSAAAEAGYAQFLSTYLGHDVDVRTDLRALDSSKLAYLESRDLIIVSTRTDSGAYYADPLTSQWNSLTSPLLLHNMLLLRTERWKWMDTSSFVPSTGNTITDLIVAAPGSPLFDHTTITGGLVNLFADAGQPVACINADLGSNAGVQLAGYGINNRPFIAQWDAGVEFYSGAGQTPGGNRMLFGNLVYGDSLAGLSNDGMQMVANAVQTSLNLPTSDLDKIKTLVRYEFSQTQSGETGPGYLPTIVANGLVDTFDMAVKDTAGKITMNIRNTGRLRINPAGSAVNLDEAVINDKFFEFSIKPEDEYALDLISLSFDVARGGATAPRGWGLFSSVDGFTGAIATEDASSVDPTFSHVVIGLTDPQFQGLGDAITFRMYTYSPASGQTIEFDNITLMGIVPEPSAAILLAISLLSAWFGFGWRKKRFRT